MKTRNLVGGAMVGALVFGIWLGSFFKGPGLGGSGTGFGISDTTSETLSDTRVQATNASSTGTSSPRASTGNTTPAPDSKDPEIGLPTQLITIVIHDDQFRLMTGDDPKHGVELTLNDIRQRAGETVGTSEGIRVRILKERSAREGARSDLLNALAAAGVKREEIQERAEFIK